MKESKQYWLIKSEPNTRLHNGKDIKFSIEDLEKCNTSIWDGVRNYEARNILRDRMKPGDLCLFYHSSCPIPGIVGLARIITEGYPDPSAFNKDHPYYDPKSDKNDPRWFSVDVQFERKLKRLISLKELQSHKNELNQLPLLNRGRLSIQPVPKECFDFIMELETQDINSY